MKVRKYQSTDRAVWDAFVRTSKNGTFLFERGYCEYHADRFVDHSLLALDDKDRVVALLPCSEKPGVVSSHGGLTYGGLVTGEGMTLAVMLQTLEAVLEHYKSAGFDTLVYKAVPSPYHRLPADEDLIAMYLLDARLTRRAALAVIDQQHAIGFQERRRRGVKKAAAAGVTVALSEDLAAYWVLLTEVLQQTYEAKPVHTLDEIQKLRSAFPENIKLYAAHRNGAMIAGVLVYESQTVARAQYIAAGPEGKEVQALDLLFHTLVHEIYRAKRYFEFGTSENGGPRAYLKGLIEQKEGFGARMLAQDQYEISLKTFEKGQLMKAFA